jgi:hypothetical protein
MTIKMVAAVLNTKIEKTRCNLSLFLMIQYVEITLPIIYHDLEREYLKDTRASTENRIQKYIQIKCNNKLITMGLLNIFFDCSLKLLMSHSVLRIAKLINIGSEGKSIPNEPISYSKENGRIAIKTKYNHVGWIVNINVKIPNNGITAIQYSFIQKATKKLMI